MHPPVRRVITGQTSDGESVFTHIEEVEPIRKSNNLEWYGVWGWNTLPTLPYHNDQPYLSGSVFPAPDGKSVRVNTIVFPAGYGFNPADTTTKIPDAAQQAADEAYAKLMAAQSPGGRRDANGMHSTDTVDLGFVFSGEICLIQGDGSEVTLRPGDVLVQNGATHAWKNRSDQPCMVCFVVMGTPREESSATSNA